MKPRAPRALAGIVFGLALQATHAFRPAAALEAGDPSPSAAVATPLALAESPSPGPAASATPAASDAKGNGKKDSNSPTPTPKTRKVKEINFPLPVGKESHGMRLPNLDQAGKILQMMMASRAKRVDNEHVELEEAHLDLNQQNGKEDMHVDLPACVFNLTTHVITSDHPVSVRTQDFELYGQQMEFNTVERNGRLIGQVRMVIHNLKQVAGTPDATPKPQ